VAAGEDDLGLAVTLANDDATGRDGVAHARSTAGTDAGHRVSSQSPLPGDTLKAGGFACRQSRSSLNLDFVRM